jgi:hypothetical protein
MDLKIIAPAIIVIIIAGVFGVLNIAKTQIPYTAQECENVQVPYTAQECANVQVPYAGQSCTNKVYAYNAQTPTCTQFSPGIFSSTPAKVTCTVNNLENRGGTFSITYGFIIAGASATQSENVNIYASSSASRSYSYNGEVQQCVCYATPPTYQDCQSVTQYKTETQCKDITKYRTETQCKDVTKYRTVSLWQSMFG